SALSTAPSLTDTYTLSLHDALPISVDGRQGPKVFLPVDLRHVGGQVIEFSQALQLFAAQAIRKLRPQALLHRVQPDAEQRLVNAALVPVALFVELADPANPRARCHRHHGLVRWVILRGQHQLPLRTGRTAERADIAVGPLLLRDPGERVVSVAPWIAQDLPVAPGVVSPSLVLHDEGVAALDRFYAPLQLRAA